MFMGRHTYAVDNKGRLAIPARLREAIPLQADRTTFCLCRGHDKCLTMFTERDWQERVKALRNSPAPPDMMLVRNRLLFSSVQQVSVDSQGRILLPPDHKKYAEITGDVIIIGVDDHIEIWSKENWEAYEAKHSSTYDDIDNEIAKRSMLKPSQSGPDVTS